MGTEANFEKAEIRRIQQRFDRELTVSCVVLCVLLFLILGILPVSPPGLSRIYRPVFIFITLFTIDRSYPLRSSRWQLVLMVYYGVIFICNQITGTAVNSFVSHELFILFFILAAQHRWSRREISLIMEVTILACDLQALVVLVSNSFLLHAGSQQHINYMWISTNRNPIAFAIVPGAIASMMKLIYSNKGWRVVLPRVFWAFSFMLCSYDVFAIGCRSAFYSMCMGLACLVWDRVRSSRTAAEKIIKEVLIAVLIIAGVFILLEVASGSYSERLFSLEDSGREEIWEKAQEMIKKKPVFGGGFDYWESAGLRIGTHNTFITYALEGGILILLIVIGHLLFLGLEIVRTGSMVSMAFFCEGFMHMVTETGMDYYAYLPLILCLIIMRYLQYQGDVQKLFNG